MRRILIIACFLPLIIQCNTQEKVVMVNQSIKISDTIEFYVEKEIMIGEQATFEFRNNSQQPVTVFGPWLKNIEKFEGGVWRKVRILYCPCGANCSSPPKILILQPTEKHIIIWNQLEGWCDKKEENGIPLTIENQSTNGLYRISTIYSVDGINRINITKEFKIIN